MLYVEERFTLPAGLREHLHSLTPHFGFSGLGEAAFMRSYSRIMRDDQGQVLGQELWADVVARVIEGVISIYKDIALRRQDPGMTGSFNEQHRNQEYWQHVVWDEGYWRDMAWRMAIAMFKMQWLPPGRGLWMCGADYMYERGSAALFNCAYVDVGASNKEHFIANDLNWIMDMLMCGVGVGFSAQERGLKLTPPDAGIHTYIIPDTREGWAESVRLLMQSYEEGSDEVAFDYSQLRPAGEPIRGFGGVASGPGPLQILHERIRDFCYNYLLHQAEEYDDYTETRLIADLVNAIGACVVAGNVRRSAEIMLGDLSDPVFSDLKNWERFPERGPWMHLSNNSVRLKMDEDFARLPEIAERIAKNGEPGFLNMINIAKYGRFGDRIGTQVLPGLYLKEDHATGCNPCGEISLESYETCCLSEVFPTNCETDQEIANAIEYATIYATIIQWLPTHRDETNAINAKNRRIGVSMSGIFDWYEREGMSRLVRMCRDGYKTVRRVNQQLNLGVGFSPGIRVTTVKPSGTISKLAGCSSGIHAPEYGYYLRRMRLAADWPGRAVLDAAGIPCEPDQTDPLGTAIYEFPIAPAHDWPVRTVNAVSMWEQLMLLMAIQRHWADNMVSMTIKFDPATDIENLEKGMALVAGNIKSASFLPIFDPMVTEMVQATDSVTKEPLYTNDGSPLMVEIKKVAYPQLPEEPITREEYEQRAARLKPFDWSRFISHDQGAGEKYCTGDSCEVDLVALMKAKQ